MGRGLLRKPLLHAGRIDHVGSGDLSVGDAFVHGERHRPECVVRFTADGKAAIPEAAENAGGALFGQSLQRCEAFRELRIILVAQQPTWIRPAGKDIQRYT